MKRVIPAAIAALCLASAPTLAPALAGEITLKHAASALSLHEAGVDMAVYYAAGQDSAVEVVATWAASDGAGEAQRMVMGLEDGDTVRLGLPGRRGTLFVFARAGDRVTVKTAPADSMLMVAAAN